MVITIVGTGYVGLVTGACFAEMGHSVTCVDIDSEKIDRLNAGLLPIYEPGLDKLVEDNIKQGRLNFTASLKSAQYADVFFIAVGTPPREDGSADLSSVLSVAKELGQVLSRDYSVVVDKSTVPVGTADIVAKTIRKELDARQSSIRFDVASNPEFLREGVAIEDFMRPDRVVIGTDSIEAFEALQRLYHPFMRNHEVILKMGLREAEMTKYAANALLATKISFMNEIANLCEKMSVDVEDVRLGIGSDERIGYSFIYPGCGYGGSCFPKDVNALIRMAQESGMEPTILSAVENRNIQQKLRLPEKIFARFGRNLSGMSFAIWGLAFKPGTDDMREAPSLILISELVRAGATVRVYDPVAIETARSEIDTILEAEGKVHFSDDQYEALEGADALVLVTEWKPFRNPDFSRIYNSLETPIIFDGRNQFEPVMMRDLGIEYRGIGRGQQD